MGTAKPGVGSQVRSFFVRLHCGSRGHCDLPVFGYGQLSLRCAICGRETDGWRWSVKTVAQLTARHSSSRTH